MRALKNGARRAARSTPPQRRVLIVDDSAMHRLWLEAMLAGRYALRAASDGQTAVDSVAVFRPDVILLDVMMPGMDGLTACRALRARPEGRSIPIILVTSKREEWDVEAGFASGCTDYITKPVDRLELLAKMESWLEAVPVTDGEVG
jgi:CheY-like chemotaxis protein